MMTDRLRSLTCLSALIVGAWFIAPREAAAQAVTTPSNVLTIPSVQSPPPLDPKADVAAWKDAAAVALPWDVQHQKQASEPATARVATDGANIYVRFDVKQRETLLAQQHTNDVGDGTDDEVWIDLWPNGSSGFYYQFAATSNGTHFQYSSENTAYSPTWTSYGAASGNDFVVTMKIPIKVMRGSGGRAGWKVQFVRIIRSTGERQIWTYGPAQTNGDDVNYAGAMNGLAQAVAARPKPRFALYGLGGFGSSASGLTTSRMGGDFSVPVTATSSVYGTIHPDFSNVEIDQQTISPTAYQRSFSEVRPFFTQGANFYDRFSCDACPFVAQLYTPAIPTPRDGYAFEGKQGRFTFAGFDAVGTGRNDGAAAVGYLTPDNHWSFTAQTVAANFPGLTDHTDTAGVSWNDNKHVSAYFDYGNDHGTNVIDGSQAQRYDGGLYYYTNTFGFAASARKVGAYYEPVDGFVQHADIAGYALYTDKIWLFDKKSWINSIQFGEFMDRYHGHDGAFNQTDNSLAFDLLTQSRIDINAGIGSAYVRLDNGVMTPISQNGVGITWHSGTANNPGSFGFHGSSATPTSITYNTGRFGPGRVDSWTRSSAMRAGPRGTLALEADDTRAYEDGGATNVQWLERLGYSYATGPNSSFAVGVRRIIGTQPMLELGRPPGFTSAWNVSFAYHRRTPHDELYFAYGDASQLSTLPQFLIKFIHYFGAEKGT
ncbi:MAG TPA: hypothetical protein VK669_13240 [Candidatus Limnocylindrales bacterium]|nr:hypothetical protein [Candidatus Limnocylindrales bacterium]